MQVGVSMTALGKWGVLYQVLATTERINANKGTVQPAYMERFGVAKTVPYIQKKPCKRGSHIYIHSRKYCKRNIKTSLRDTNKEVFILKLPCSYDQGSLICH